MLSSINYSCIQRYLKPPKFTVTGMLIFTIQCIFIHFVHFYAFYVIFCHSYFVYYFRTINEKYSKKMAQKTRSKKKSRKHRKNFHFLPFQLFLTQKTGKKARLRYKLSFLILRFLFFSRKITALIVRSQLFNIDIIRFISIASFS